jgi:DNA-binding XRE family transcriptional regulator
MDRAEFVKIRHDLNKTQEQLASLLCVSHKAIQSFEQGWRNIPSHIEREMLLLASLQKSPAGLRKPCWEATSCPPEWREHCIVWDLKAKHYCWYLNGTYCQGNRQTTWEKKIALCRTCQVYLAVMEVKRPG